MTPAGGLLELGVHRAARWLALRFLEDAAAARARLGDPGDAEALHDFRVALRRLRSTIRAYADHLDEGIGRRDRRRLRALARATGAARDGQVMMRWMEARRDALAEPERPGMEWLLERLRARQEKLDRALRDEVARDFGRERRRLERRLSRYTASVTAADPREEPRIGAVAAGLLLAHAGELRDALDAVASVDDQDRLHEGRIAAKRLRYLLEPFAAELPAAAWAVKRLRRMQDVLGETHDAHVAAGLLAEERAEAEALDPTPDPDPLPGLDALAAAARAETERLYGEAEGEWLRGRAAEFFARVEALAEEMRGGADHEIERKFLLRRMPRLPDGAVPTEVWQGYLPGERLVERVRRVRRDGGEPRYYRTVKLGSGVTRTEVEEEADEATFRRLWPLTRGRRVRKVRFEVPDGDYTWEIDRFRDRRLVLAEVELPREDAEVSIPGWLRDHVERDVTGEDAYVNVNLAQ